MANYVKLQQTAVRLIKKNGRPITFSGTSKVPGDPLKVWNGPSRSAPSEPLTLDGVFVPPNTVREFGLPALGEGTDFTDLLGKSQQVIITAQGDNDLRGFSIVTDIRGDSEDAWGIIGLQVLRPGPLGIIAFVGVRR